MITEIPPWILFLVAISHSRFKVESVPCENTTCSPFRLLVIWHTSNGEDSAFIEQKRLIIRMIHKIPQGTEVQVTTINTQLNHILHFETNRVNDWINNISLYSPDYLENHNIQGSLINTLVFNFNERSPKKDVANKVLLVVSEITELEKRSFEIIKNVERLVVFTGRNPPPPLWKFLATNIDYLVTLNTTAENVMSNINGAAKTVLDLLCQVDSAPYENSTCSPFRLLVIWHTSNGEDSAFKEQKRLIIRMIHKIPQGTEVQVTTINTQLNHILHFKTNRAKDWIYNISLYSPDYLENHTIHGFLINTLVFNFRERSAKKDVANKVLLVVSEKTDLEKRSFETIKNVERLLVFTGRNSHPPLWKSLATNIDYLVTLNTTAENDKSNIHGAAKTVLELLCQDSRLNCDTDEFLAGESCVSCSYICSEDTKTPPDICRELCPYYKRFTPKNTAIETNKRGTGTKPTTVWILISGAFFVLLVY